MGNLTNDQAIEVSQILQQLADAIADFVISNQNVLEPADKQTLTSTQAQVLDLADQVLDKASDLVFDDVNQQLAQMNAVNGQIAASLKTLGTIQNVIEVAADVLALATSVCSLNAGGATQAISDLVTRLGVKV